MLQQLRLPAIALAFAVLGAAVVVGYGALVPDRSGAACRAGADVLARLELLFGMGKKDGSEVSDAEWRALMVMTGYGQWRNSAGGRAKEKSRVVEIWYRPIAESEARIEAIRTAYKVRFQQDSVMRVDSASCVSF